MKQKLKVTTTTETYEENVTQDVQKTNTETKIRYNETVIVRQNFRLFFNPKVVYFAYEKNYFEYFHSIICFMFCKQRKLCLHQP